MQTKVFLQQTSNLFTENRLLKFVIVVLALAVGVNSFMVSRAVRNQRVILIPPKLTGTIEFVDGKPSDQYIRDLARRLASLAATYSPATARSQFDELLAFYAPEAYPDAAKAWYALAGRVEESQVSAVFYLRDLKLDQAGQRLELSGDQRQFTEDKLIEARSKTFEIRYRIEDGRFFLTSFTENTSRRTGGRQ
ncbi:MAG: type IV conjugative transfer system protein TraE [Desulfobacteraceae bacterium]|nr:type IV conjugative transfer system protein TraE [Desulfobacteraceae bacterium]